MARAIVWAIDFDSSGFNCVNVGSNDWNYRVIELAERVASHFEDVALNINEGAPDDDRSYKVCFDKFMRLAPNHQPLETLDSTIARMSDQIIRKTGQNASNFIRLNVLGNHVNEGNSRTTFTGMIKKDPMRRFDVETTNIDGMLKLKASPFKDDRGSFQRLFCSKLFVELGCPTVLYRQISATPSRRNYTWYAFSGTAVCRDETTILRHWRNF